MTPTKPKQLRPNATKDWAVNLTIRLSTEDQATLREKALEAGMSQSEYVRFLIRRARIRVSVEIP